MNANGRVLDVNAYTTLDFVEATARGPGWADEGIGVLDVSSEDHDSGADAGSTERAADGVVLEFELDPTACDRLEPHVDRVRLTREQARTLADALVAASRADGSDGGGRDAR